MKMTHNRLMAKWLNGSVYDAARVAGTFLEVKEQFFQHHNFVVLPYPSAHSVFLPDIDYSSFIAVKHAPTYHPGEFSPELLAAIQRLLDTYPSIKKVDHSDIQTQFEYIQPQLEQSLKMLFPHLYKNIKSMTLITTAYGSEGSFDYKKEGNNYHLFIWIRTTGISSDSIIAQLIHCIVSVFVLISTKVADSKTAAWKQREAIVDFLLQHTQLHDLWNQVYQTLRVVESKQKSQKISADSHQYLHKLKATITPPRISKKGEIYRVDSIALEHLNVKEEQLLSILYSHKNTFVDKDTLYEALYGEDGGSDWSLSKLIERLRNKIENAGILYPIILTSRRQGYKLVSS